MRATIFVPKYRKDFLFFPILFAPIATLILWSTATHSGIGFEFWVFAFVALFVIGLLPYTAIKRIIFEEDYFRVERYFWRIRTIRYGEIVGFGIGYVKTRRGNIALTPIENRDELIQIFLKLHKKDKIQNYQVTDRVVRQDSHAYEAMRPAWIAAVIIGVILSLILFPHQPMAAPLLIGGLFFLIYMIVYRGFK